MKRAALLLSLFFVTSFIVILLSFYLYLFAPANPLAPSPKITFKIPRGTSFSAIMDTLEAHGLIRSRQQFYMSAKAMNMVTGLQAGSFNIPGGLNYFDMVRHLSHASQKQIRITIPEGMEMTEIADLFHRELEIDPDEFMSWKDSVQHFIPPTMKLNSLEGCLYPDTYFFYEDMDAEDVISRMTAHFTDVLNRNEILRSCDSLHLTLNSILAMASIIQGEVIIDREMPIVSAVYWNRLRKRMKLQADPTIQYIIPGPDKRLRNRHLALESPYNTYLHYGLPPGPINNPGIQAIRAALYPSHDSYLYFVAIGDGSHHFSRTLEEHNRAKEKFDKYRRKIYWQKKLQNRK